MSSSNSIPLKAEVSRGKHALVSFFDPEGHTAVVVFSEEVDGKIVVNVHSQCGPGEVSVNFI